MTKMLLVVFACLISVACSNGGDSIKWTEDVLLPDGRVVTLTRYQEFKGPHEIGQPPTASDYWLEFKHPDTSELVRWQYGRDLGTVALMVSEGRPYLLVDPHFGSSRRDFNCPDPPYFLYRYENGSWERVDIKSIPVKKVSSNMSYTDEGDRNKIIKSNYRLTVAQTRERYVLTMQPWVMDFSNMPEQTFGHFNCAKQSNYLLVKP